MISIGCIYLKLLFFYFFMCFFFVAFRDQERRLYEVIVLLFFYIDLIFICRVKKFMHRLVCNAHIPCFAEDRGLI